MIDHPRARASALTRRHVLIGGAAAGVLGTLHDAAAQTAAKVTIAMSLGDVPRLWAGPDGGFEGLRFGGYTVFDALVSWDLSAADKPSTLVPGLAESWSMDPADRTRWIVKLRPGVTFHDGTPFDADAAVWNFASVFDDKAPQYLAQRALGIRGRLPSVKGAEKIDATTIAILTHAEDSLLPYQLTFLLFASPARYAALGNDWMKFAGEPAGTGPFKVVRLEPRVRLELARNDAYWDKPRVAKSATLVLVPIPDGTARVSALRAGQVDFIESVPPDTIPSLKGAGFAVTQNVYPHTWIWYLSVLPGSAFADKRVRKAANLAIDRAGIVEMLNGTAIAAEGLVPRSSPWFGKPGFVLKHDPAAAKRLLAEAGYGPGKPAQAKILIANSGGGQMQPLPMNEAIQQSLAEVGIGIEYQVVDFITLFTAYRNGAKPPADNPVGLNLSLPTQDPTSGFVRCFDSALVSPRGTNWGHYANPAVDAAFKKAQLARDVAARDQAMAEAHALLVDDAVALMVVHDRNPRAMSAKLKGFVQPQNWFADFSPVAMG
ncbi:ABC transporter substrate-binding protein [Rhodoplanes sp. SY1]|uniref:ABC transporter substrate-binding protein n=1 Tax=Rhodoplanes sp. SY1 TaxID=3166646 RepID=UPI0038B42004